MAKYQAGEWQPYSHEELLDVVGFSLLNTPRFCRITRVVRDIPSNDIVVGNKYTNFRQMAETYIKNQGGVLQDIRSREIKGNVLEPSKLVLKDTVFQTRVSVEHFLEYMTPDERIAAFLRLSLPGKPKNPLTNELNNAALIREVHVYGQAVSLGTKKSGAAQHAGLGKKLIQKALKLSKSLGYAKVSVISAIGTRNYYRKLGFKDGELYQHYEF